MPPGEEDLGAVRDHLANERTQLAWLRTAGTVMVLGLAIARFGEDGSSSGASLAAGGLLVLTGAAGAVYGSMRYRATYLALRKGVTTGVAASTGPVVAAGVLVVAMLVAVAILTVA